MWLRDATTYCSSSFLITSLSLSLSLSHTHTHYSSTASPSTVTSLQLFCSVRNSETFGLAHGSARFSTVKSHYVHSSLSSTQVHFHFEFIWLSCACSRVWAGTSWCYTFYPDRISVRNRATSCNPCPDVCALVASRFAGSMCAIQQWFRDRTS